MIYDPKFTVHIQHTTYNIHRQLNLLDIWCRRAHSKKTWIWNVCDVNIIWFPAIEDKIGINLMKAFRIIDPTVLEQVTFHKKRLMEMLLWMVLGLNVGTIGNHWYRLVPLNDDWKGEVIFFTVNWQTSNLCRSLFVIINITSWPSWGRENIVKRINRDNSSRRMIKLDQTLMRSSLWSRIHVRFCFGCNSLWYNVSWYCLNNTGDWARGTWSQKRGDVIGIKSPLWSGDDLICKTIVLKEWSERR